MRDRGFTLIECLVAAAISLLIVCASLEYLVSAQKHFAKLKERTEASQALYASLDKIRVDILHAGRGLAGPAAAGLVEAVQAPPEELRTISLAAVLVLSGEARAGDLRISLVSTADISRGQEICLYDGLSGEVRTIAGVEPGAVVLSEPLESAYSPETASVLLLDKVAYFLDQVPSVLRRRVNAGSAQPLLEDVSSIEWRYDPSADLVDVRLETRVEGVAAHGMSVFIKNAALARLF